MKRRGFLRSLIAAPAVIRTPGLLMPVRPIMGLLEGSITGVSRNTDILEFESMLGQMWENYKIKEPVVVFTEELLAEFDRLGILV